MRLIHVPRRVAKRVVRTASTRLVRAIGIDATDEIARRSCLVVAPHPDDETLGCAATIARMRSLRTPVHVVIISGGGLSPRPTGMAQATMMKTRRTEAVRALSILGVDRSCIRLWDFEDGALADSKDHIASELKGVLSFVSPAQVFVTSTHDRHHDHRAVAQAVTSATQYHAPSVPVLEYPIWQRIPAINAMRGLTSTRPLLVSTEGFLHRKRDAVSAYKSQLPHFPIGFLDDFTLPFEAFRPAYCPLPVIERTL